MRRLFLLAATAAGLCLPATITGCHSAFMQATVVNQTGGPVHLFEVDYPDASFGGGDLANGAAFHYRFKILGTGETKATWTDAARHDHSSKGPELREGQEGTLTLTLLPDKANWEARFSFR